MNSLIKCSFVFVFFTVFCAAAMAQANDSGSEEEPATAQQMPTSFRWVKGLSDGNQPVMPESKSILPPTVNEGDRELEQIAKTPRVHTPLWKVLDELSFSDKENALIQLEVPHDLSAGLLKQVQEIEELWNTGSFKKATDRLRNLEEMQGLHDIAVGISWKVLRVISNPKWGTDVQVGSQQDIQKPCLDFHYATGNLFVVLKRFSSAGDPRWTTYISTDGGQIWQATFSWLGDDIIDVSAAVVDTFLYVAYVAQDVIQGRDAARIRRFLTRDGSVDNGYYYMVVFDKDIDIEEIALTTNADFYDNRIYYLAILADNSLVCCWADQDGLTWWELATGVTGAAHSLDACTNQDYEDYFLFVSYVGLGDTLHVVRKSTVWEDIRLEDIGIFGGPTSIGAYDDRIMTVFHDYYDNLHRIRYWISYDGGDNWFYGPIASGDGPDYFSPDVTARRGGGFAVIYQNEVGQAVDTDTCWYRHRIYSTGPYEPHPWSPPVPLSQVDVFTGTPTSVEWIPSQAGVCHSYGAVWVSDDPPGAFFDRDDRWLPGDANFADGVEVGDVVILINYLFKYWEPPNPPEVGDLTCDGEITVDDVVYLIAYLFREGPTPHCCPIE